MSTRPLLNVKQVAEQLSVSVSTVYDLVGQGKLSCFRIGSRGRGAIRFSESQIEEYLASREKACMEPSPRPKITPLKKLKHLSLE